MTPSKLPAVATWLLEHAGFSTTGGVIAGDLLEQFNGGRSAAWYWHQVLMAIVVGWASEVRHHRVLAARAMLITWAANYAVLMLGREVMIDLFRHRFLPYHPLLAMWAICFLGGLASGLMVALLHRGHRNAMLLTGTAALLGWALTAIVFLKKGALEQSLLKIAGATVAYYFVALIGFTMGGFMFTPGPDPGALASPTSDASSE